MDALVIIPFILFLVVICTAIAERINIPYPLLVIVVGLAVGFIPAVPNWHPDTNLVLPVFLPPILFAAARLISWQDIKSNLLEIGVLSLVLVITTAIGMAITLPILAPYFTLASAFVLGAIISPTDSISATSILNKMNTKPRLVRSLEIESLFNDAVSITLYKISLFLVVTGSLDIHAFTLEILLSSCSGIAIGLLLAFFTNVIVNNFLRDSDNELPIIMGLILAYVAYLFAERVGASGVLSVVAAGLFHIRTERRLKARTRLAEQASWNTFIFFLNGVIFIVIGLQFPVYWHRAHDIPLLNLFYFSLITIASLLLLRLVWIGLLAGLSRLFSAYHLLSRQATRYTWRDVIISTLSGMRGMVSLALALAIPTHIAPNIPFPDRDLIILLTIIVILFTVVIQGLILPFVVRWLGATKDSARLLAETNDSYRYITEQAIAHITLLQSEQQLTSSIAKKLVDNYYEGRLLQFNLSQQLHSKTTELSDEAEKWLRHFLQYERELLYDLLKQGKISQDAYVRIVRKIDRDEVGFGLDT